MNNYCSIERMICYLIEANRRITDEKDKYLENYIAEVKAQVNKDTDLTIVDRINTIKIDKYIPIPDKWKKINKELIPNYSAIIFQNLLNEFGDITEEKIIKETKSVLADYSTELELSAKCLKIYQSLCI